MAQRLSSFDLKYQQRRAAAAALRRARTLELQAEDEAALEAELAAYELQRWLQHEAVSADGYRCPQVG
jgi:hypothetical protein